MKLTKVLEKLSGLCGGVWKVEAQSIYGAFNGSLQISSVDELQPRERIAETSGNVILSYPERDKNGYPRGVTFWAKDVVSIAWDGKEQATIKGKNESQITFCFLHPLIVGSAEIATVIKLTVEEHQENVQMRLFE